MRIGFVVAAVAVLALTACSHETNPAATASNAPSSSATTSSATSEAASSMTSAPTSSAASTSSGMPTKGEQPTKEFLYGKWGTDGDCELAIDLRPDGTSDGPFGNWTYTDARSALSMRLI